MDITISVDKETIHPIIQTYEEKIRRNKEIAAKAMNEAKKLSDLVSQLRYNEVQLRSDNGEQKEETPIITEEFSLDWSLPKKMQYFLQNSLDPLSSKQLTEKIMEVDKKLAKDKAKAFKNISTILSVGNGTKYKRIREKTNGKKEYHYSLS